MDSKFLRDFRTSAIVLLRLAVGDGAHDRRRAPCGVWQAGALVIPNSGELVCESAVGKRVRSRCCLSRVDFGSAAALSIMQMVRSREGAPQRLVAVLLVICQKRKRKMRPLSLLILATAVLTFACANPAANKPKASVSNA